MGIPSGNSQGMRRNRDLHLERGEDKGKGLQLGRSACCEIEEDFVMRIARNKNVDKEWQEGF